jgi:lipopolysaccharide/colanic/teichoic acid biosynthesis glycosyltransferase
MLKRVFDVAAAAGGLLVLLPPLPCSGSSSG